MKLRFTALKHRILRFCSESYRQHLTVVSDRERWRRECVEAGNSASLLRSELREAREIAGDLRERLKLAVEAQQQASEQLIAERALRQSADERADRYHAELTESLKSNVDWLARGLYHRRPMFGVGALPDEPQKESTPIAMPGKRMAREVARENTQQVTSEALKDMLEQIRQGEAIPIGPEFTTQ